MRMETREDILRELKELAPKLASLDKFNVYSIPENYFLNFKNSVLEKVKSGEAGVELKAVAPELAKIEKSLAIDMPVNYFGNFSDGLLKKIRANEVANELAELAPALSKLEKVNAFEVPANYFKSSAQEILRKVQRIEEKPAATSKWMESLSLALESAINIVFKPKYSIAFAGLATTVIVGVMMFIKIQQGDQLDNKLASLTTEEINSYLDNKSEGYTEQIFESNFEETSGAANDKVNNIQPYKDALKDVDDAALDAAIAD